MSDNCHVDPVQKTATAQELENSTFIFLAVYGMGCPRCAMRVYNSLISTEGVTDAIVDHTVSMAKVVFNPTMVTSEALIDAVARAGNDGRHQYWAALLA